jgi:uncharacterized protein YjdB
MRKIFLLVAGSLLGAAATAQSPFAAGDGTALAPYQISNRAQLDSVRNYADKYFALTADIDLGGESWTPIATFTGKLHGYGHSLRNIIIDGGTTAERLGLFATLGAGAYIEDVHIVGGEIKNGANAVCAGGIAGYAGCSVAAGKTDSIVIAGCSNSANINTTGKESATGNPGVGGIVGKVDAVTGGNARIVLRKTANTGKITGGYNAGGLVGRATTSAAAGNTATLLVTNSYSNAPINTTRTQGASQIGGLVGYLDARAHSVQSVTKSFALGNVSGVSSSGAVAGGIAGRMSEVDEGGAGTVNILDCVSAHDAVSSSSGHSRRIVYDDTFKPEAYTLKNYANSAMSVAGTVTSDSSKNAGLGKAMSELRKQATYKDGLSWDFAGTWAIRDGKSLPYFNDLSAPVFVGALYTDKQLRLDVAAGADSVVAYKGDSRVRLGALTSNLGDAVYNHNISGWGVRSGDVLYLICYEPGRKPSMETSVTLEAADVAHAGDGTAESPYLVPDYAALASIVHHLGASKATEHFRLTADIDLAGISWLPIGVNSSDAFHGKLHGGGHSIRNINVSTIKPNAGLFAALGRGAVIDSLHIAGGTIASSANNSRVGGIAGAATAGSGSIEVRGCSNSALINVAALDGFGGGIIGGASTGGAAAKVTVASCANGGAVTGSGNALGGIVGATNDVTLTTPPEKYGYTGKISIVDCYSVASVKVSKNNSNGSHGGILGYAYTSDEGTGKKYADTVSIINCYAAGTVEVINTDSEGSGSGDAGGITGKVRGKDTTTLIAIAHSVAAQSKLVTTKTNYRIIGIENPGVLYTLSNNYANESMPVNGRKPTAATIGADKGSGADKTVAELQQQATYKGLEWDFTNTWAIREGKSYPYFGWQSPPVAVNSISMGAKTVTLDVPASVTSLEIYASSGSIGGRALAKTITAGLSSSPYVLDISSFGNLFYVVSYEAGKQASYPIELNLTPVTGVKLSARAIGVEPNSTLRLTATVAPADATDPAVTWKSLNTAIATVSADGVVTGAAGVVKDTTLVVVTTLDGSFADTCQVIVRQHVSVTGVVLAKRAVTINKNLTDTLACTVSPADAQLQEVTWRSLNAEVATVDSLGVVTAVETGKTKIIVTTVENELSDTCEVTVNIVPVAKVTLVIDETSLFVGSSGYQITVTIAPADATYPNVTWVSRNPAVATVSDSGMVRAVSDGKVYIVASAHNGVSDSVQVEVIGGGVNTGVAQAQAFFAAYPNPVRAGQPISLALPEGVGAATVRIFGLNGALLRQENGVRQAIAPENAGIYLLQVELPSGAKSVLRIAVE